MLDLYNSEKKSGSTPDLLDIDDILAIEWQEEWEQNANKEELNKEEVQENKTEDNNISEDKQEDNSTEEKSETEAEDKSEEKTDESSNDTSEKEDESDNNKVELSDDELLEKEEQDEDMSSEIDDVISDLETKDINMDIIKKLEQEKIERQELEAKNQVLKEKVNKLIEKVTALESWDTLSEIPAKVKGIIKMYERYEQWWDNSSKDWLVDSLAWLLTEITWKDIYKYLDSSPVDITEMWEDWNPRTKEPEKVETNDEDEFEALKEFWIEMY